MQSESAVVSKAVRQQISHRKPLESVAASASVAATAPQTNLDSAKAAKNSLSGIVSICYHTSLALGIFKWLHFIPSLLGTE